VIVAGRVGSRRGRDGGRGDRPSIHVDSRRKVYQVRNDFLFFVVPEL